MLHPAPYHFSACSAIPWRKREKPVLPPCTRRAASPSRQRTSFRADFPQKRYFPDADRKGSQTPARSHAPCTRDAGSPDCRLRSTGRSRLRDAVPPAPGAYRSSRIFLPVRTQYRKFPHSPCRRSPPPPSHDGPRRAGSPGSCGAEPVQAQRGRDPRSPCPGCTAPEPHDPYGTDQMSRRTWQFSYFSVFSLKKFANMVF